MSYHEGSNWQAKKEDEGKPLYGEEQFQKEVNRRLSPNPHQEGDKAPIDAGRLPTAEDVKRWYQLLVGVNEKAMQNDIQEVLEQLRIPDAGMAKIIGDAWNACRRWLSFESGQGFLGVKNPHPTKDQYIKQAMEVINNFKK